MAGIRRFEVAVERGAGPRRTASCSAKAGHPVRRSLSIPSLLSLEYWIVRPSAQLRTRRTMTAEIILAARCARSFAGNLALEIQSARGRPGARCTRGLVCNMHKEKRTRAYRFSGNTPAFPAQWLCGLYVIVLVTGFLATSASSEPRCRTSTNGRRGSRAPAPPPAARP